MSLTFYFGTMSSGKSARILQKAYHLDGKLRFGLYTCENKDVIDSRIGIERKCEHISSLFSDDSSSLLQVILIDEAQWLTREQVFELKVWSEQYDINVCCFGLRSDVQGGLFEGSSALFTLADNFVHMSSYCAHCSNPAVLHNKITGEGKEGFEEVCLNHFTGEK